MKYKSLKNIAIMNGIFSNRLSESILISGKIFIIYYFVTFVILQFGTHKILTYPIFTIIITPVIYSYLFISLTLFLPFTLLNMTFSGEKPLNPIGFIITVFIFCLFIYFILWFIEIVMERKITYFNDKTVIKKIISIVVYLYTLFYLIFPFFYELDFF